MDINLPHIHAEVTAAFNRYEAALNANDTETLDELFWASPHTIRYGQSENLHGIEQIRSFRTARPNTDLTRDLAETIITTFGTHTATASTLFRRRGSGRTGRQMQTWIKINTTWHVVAAHVSFLDFDWPG